MPVEDRAGQTHFPATGPVTRVRQGSNRGPSRFVCGGSGCAQIVAATVYVTGGSRLLALAENWQWRKLIPQARVQPGTD